MPKVSEPIDDTTSLAASRIGIPARIGWLLRSSRTAGGLSLREMSTSLREHDVRLSSTTLGRIESHGIRSPAALDGYASVLGLGDGSLRAAVDTLCHSFAYAPPTSTEAPRGDLEQYGDAIDGVDVASPSGGAWMRFAQHHARPDGFGLPRRLFEPYLRRLLEEMLRANSKALITRFVSLGDLDASAYSEIVERLAVEMMHAPGTPRVDWFTSFLSDRPSIARLRWFGELLSHESPTHASAGSYGLQSMLVAGGISEDQWRAELVPAFARAWDRLDDASTDHRSALVQLCAALPPSLRRLVRERCRIDDATATTPRTWARNRHNVHYEFARDLALGVTTRQGHAEEPLLARLLFEAMFDPRGVRMTTSTWLLVGSAFAHPLVDVLVEARDLAPDEASCTAALRVAALLHDGGHLPAVAPYFASPVAAHVELARTIAGRSGATIPQLAVDRGFEEDESTALRTVDALGFATDPRLGDLAAPARSPASVRDRARWWIDHGGRVVR